MGPHVSPDPRIGRSLYLLLAAALTASVVIGTGVAIAASAQEGPDRGSGPSDDVEVVGAPPARATDPVTARWVRDLAAGASAEQGHPGQQLDSPDDGALTAHVGDVARKFGLQVSAVRVLHPLESALDVTLVVPDDDAPDWTIDQLSAALLGDSPQVEGLLIELQAPSGDPLLRTSAAFRVGDGSLWFAPGQDERFGAVHSSGPWAADT